MRAPSTVKIPLYALLGVLVGAGTAVAADPELGKEVYTKRCASCHGGDGNGNAKMAAMLKVKIPPLADAATKDDAELLKVVSEGKKPMPAFGKNLGKDELEAVVHYVKTFGSK